MRRAAATVLATAALTAGLAVPGATVALANVGGGAQVDYSGTEVPPPGEVLPSTQPTPVPAAVRPVTAARTLPFTGGELVTLTAVGVGAVGAGAALVVATRRRRPQGA